MRTARSIVRASKTRQRLTPFARLILAALAVTAVVAAPSAATAAPSPVPEAAAGSIGLRLLDPPIALGEDPRARSYIVDHLAPGTVIHRQVEISNATTSAAHILLYPSAATIEDGSFLGAVGHTPNELSSWASISPPKSNVPAGGRATATVTISVPRDASPGEQYGVVWAEARTAPAGGTGIIQVSRVGIRIYLSVGPGGVPAADFTIDSLTAQRSPEGQPMVLANVHNTGGRALDMSGTLELLEGPGGLSAGPFPATLGTTLAIDATAPVTIVLDEQVPAGPWNARISLHSGPLERTAEETMTFPDKGIPTKKAPGFTLPGWAYPAMGGLAISLLGGGVTRSIVRGRRRRRGLRLRDQVRPDLALASSGARAPLPLAFFSGEPTPRRSLLRP